MVFSIPLLIVVVAIYNFLALFTGSAMEGTLWSPSLPSTATLDLSLGDLLVLLGLILLFFEIFKSTRTGTSSIVDHLLSVGLFVVCLLELVLLPAFGTATFLFLTLMSLIDVVAGFTVTISAARRDIGFDQKVL